MKTCPQCSQDQPDDFFILDDDGLICDACYEQTPGARDPRELKKCVRCDGREPVVTFTRGHYMCRECEAKDARRRRYLAKMRALWRWPNGDHRDCPRCGKIMMICRCPPAPPPTSKVCPGCTTPLLFAAFGPDKTRKDGLTVYCHKCIAERRRKQRAANARRMGHTAVATGADTEADTAPSLAPSQDQGTADRVAEQ